MIPTLRWLNWMFVAALTIHAATSARETLSEILRFASTESTSTDPLAGPSLSTLA